MQLNTWEKGEIIKVFTIEHYWNKNLVGIIFLYMHVRRPGDDMSYDKGWYSGDSKIAP